MPDTPQQTTAEANRLYWETDTSVADIAQQLDISRRALYNAVEPLPAGRDCPVCGTPLVFENRSGRTAGAAVCPACADAVDAADDQDAAADGDAGSDAYGAADAEPASDADTDDAADGETGGHALDPAGLRVAGAALAGAAVGALLAFALVQRR